MNRVSDARELHEGATIETDVCIIGSGAAGLTVAAELAGTPLDVCVVESGGWEYEKETQDLYGGRNAGLPYFPLDANRQRSFGGTTNLWAGWCRPLDEIDFEQRAWVPESGWPIVRREILPYYERAHAVCALGAFEYDPAVWEARLGARRLALPQDHFVTRIFRLARRNCFLDLYRERIAPAANLRVLLRANVLALETDEHGARVTGASVASRPGRRFTIVARRYVLAAGGIENARLLLASNSRHAAGVGNAHGMVGRCFMEHLHFPSGIVDLAKPRAVDAGLYHRVRDGAVGRLFLPDALQREEEVLGCSIKLEPIYRGDEFPVARALARFLDRLRRARGRNPLPRRAARALGEPVPGLPRLRRPLRELRLHHTLEQAPYRHSRVALDDRRDAFGVPRARVEWRTTAIEHRTWHRSLELLDAALRDAGIGRLRAAAPTDAWPPPPLQGMRGHHMGTTRMSNAPRHGVVDSECCVHGIANLFVAGSSVFPTSGAGTPTLTIVALALRLADRIKKPTKNSC